MSGPDALGRREWHDELTRLDAQLPFARFAFTDVQFLAADTDTAVEHPFKGIDPELVRWVPVSVEGAAYLYRTARGTRTAFQPSHILLRASAACHARVLLFVEPP